MLVHAGGRFQVFRIKLFYNEVLGVGCFMLRFWVLDVVAHGFGPVVFWKRPYMYRVLGFRPALNGFGSLAFKGLG